MFTQPFAVQVTEVEEKEIIPKLEQLGYIRYLLNVQSYTTKYIISNVGGNLPTYFTDLRCNSIVYNEHFFKYNRIILPYNLELILAIAAMNNSDYIIGEWVYITQPMKSRVEHRIPTVGLHKITALLDYPTYDIVISIGDIDMMCNRTDMGWRKATLQEILDYFGYYLDDKEVKLKNKQSDMKTIIGYKLKDKKYQTAASMIAFGNKSWIIPSMNDTLLINRYLDTINCLKEVNVLDAWFEPVYTTYKVGDWVLLKFTECHCAGFDRSDNKIVQISYYKDKEYYFPLAGKEKENYSHKFYIGFDNNTIVFSADTTEDYIIRLATPEEIEAAKKNEIKALVKASNDNYEIIITKEGIIHKSNSVLIPIGQWDSLLLITEPTCDANLKAGTFNVTHNTTSTVSIGCAKNIPHSEIKRIYDIWKENFNN